MTKWGNSGDVGWIYESVQRSFLLFLLQPADAFINRTRVPDSIGYNPTIRTTFVLASLFDTSSADNRLEHFLELLDSPHNGSFDAFVSLYQSAN